jgi:hypothetical protein
MISRLDDARAGDQSKAAPRTDFNAADPDWLYLAI